MKERIMNRSHASCDSFNLTDLSSSAGSPAECMGTNMRKIYQEKNMAVREEVLSLQETLFHNANGYIGIRGTLEEGVLPGMDTMRGTYINGVYDIAPMKQAEKLYMLVEDKETMLNVADTQTITITFDDEVFSMFDGEILEWERTLDMEEGITRRNIFWRSPKGKEVRISYKRMTSFEQLSLFTIEINVTPVNFSSDIIIQSEQNGLVRNYFNPNDPRLAGEQVKHLEKGAAQVTNEESYLVSNTVSSGLSICSGVRHQIPDGEMKMIYDEEAHRTTYCYLGNLTEGKNLQFIKYSVFTDSVRHRDCLAAAREQMEQTKEKDISYYYEKQKEYLSAFWDRSALEVYGQEKLNASVCFNLYQLLQSVGKDAHCNIAAKGLSGEGYEGHYFWDTEMYMLPFFTLTNPKLARELLAYRYTTLHKAKENAACLGHKKGALYPWRTITGRECSGYFPSGTAQYHINGDIAYAMVSYYLTTGDIDFIKEKGMEILVETARLWMDVGCYYEDSFRIHAVTGPDEYTCMVNNNYYTNACAKYNLEWTVKFAGILEEQGSFLQLAQKMGIHEDELADFSKAAARMYLPYDEKLGINPQDDSFLQKPVWDIAGTPEENFPLLLHYHPLHLYRYQVCKQADTVLAHFIFNDLADENTIKKSFRYYEKITTHDSSLSTCIFSIVASQLGMKDKAYQYFGDSAMMDLQNTHKNTKDGIHTANMGGCYMAIVNGFAGLQVKENGICLAPFRPKDWAGYSFRFQYQGSRICVEVAGDTCTIRLVQGKPVKIRLYKEIQELVSELKIKIP